MRFEQCGGDELFGRERELAVLRGQIGQLAQGTGGALVIRGGAGAGKSALLAVAADQAKACQVTVLSAAGVQAEAGLAFAGLHRLLLPVLHRANDLPPRQRSALLTAFGMADDARAEPLLTSLAALDLIGSPAATTAPCLVCVDDAQWLDQQSCAVLGFVAGRLRALPCAMVVATSDGPRSPLGDAGLTELRLEALDDDAARALLAERAPGIDQVARDRLVRSAAGNPLALIELAKASSADGVKMPTAPLLPLAEGVLTGCPLTGRLRSAFAAQADELPGATRCVLLVAAADENVAVGELLNAASLAYGSTVTVDALGAAVLARLIEVERTRLRFRHPLMRLALYQSATVADRQAAHTALAQVLGGQPDRQVWHAAAASLAPDEQLAAALDAAATRAQRQGQVVTATAAMERAAELSGSDAQRGVRLLRAAEMAFDAGHPELGSQLLKASERLDLPAEARVWLAWLTQARADARWHTDANIDSFVAMADRMRADGHPALAAESLRTAAIRCWWGNPDQAARASLVATTERMPLPRHDPTRLAILACADPLGQAATVIELISELAADLTDPAGLYFAGLAATAVWAHDLALPFLDAAVGGLRRQGRLGLLAQALVCQAWAAAHLARGPLAMSAAREAGELAGRAGQQRWVAAARLAQATLTAERGDLDAADRIASEAEAMLPPAHTDPMLALARFARGRGAVAHQHYALGAEQLGGVLDRTDPAYHPFIGSWGLADLVEASARLGRTDAARAYLARLDQLATATSAPLLRAGAGYARPLVADDDQAEPLYRAAIEDDLAGWPALRCRMLLWYGRWLRRQRRIADCRGPLRAACDGLAAIGFQAQAESARQELRASGETPRATRRCSAEACDQLTPQELQIARLAADGLSNREIGQRLYISHRTVGYHLHRIFPKLGISSRSQLHAAVSG